MMLNIGWAWKIAGCFIPISFGWEAGDVYLAAYIQTSLPGTDFRHSHISSLGTVMAFLYSTYIILNAILSVLLGRVIDKDFTTHKNIHNVLMSIAGIQYLTCCSIILLSTIIPLRVLAFNLKIIGGVKLVSDPVEAGSEIQHNVELVVSVNKVTAPDGK